MADRLDRTRTAVDGLFYFLDLPEGDYAVEVSIPGSGTRYAKARAAVNVSRDAKGNVNLDFLEIHVEATTVRGRVTAAGEKAGIPMAEVRVRGSGERAFTGVDGEFVLQALEPGKRTIVATAPGHRQDSKSAAIKRPGDVAVVDFALAPEAAGSGPAASRKR
jgi:hypothetical protein